MHNTFISKQFKTKIENMFSVSVMQCRVQARDRNKFIYVKWVNMVTVRKHG